jgi:hypothetical protein
MAIEAGTKFLGIASSVDTKERRSKAINDKSEYHTIEEIASAAADSIVLPDPVDADTIVGQLDAENYTTIESNLSGKLPYELTRINISSFKTDNANITAGVLYSSENIGMSSPFVTYDGTSFAWKMTLNTSLPLSAFVTCRIKGYGAGITIPAFFVDGQVSSTNGQEVFLIVYDASGNIVTNTASPALQFGLEVDIIQY